MFPTLIEIGGFRLAAYGVFVAAGFLAGIAYLSARRRDLGLDEAAFNRLIPGIFLTGMGGGKALYLLIYGGQMRWSAADLAGNLRFGFVYLGGFLAAAGYCAWFARRHGLAFLRLADLAAPALALGHGIGRLGCFAAGCCYGAPTDLPWGIAFRHPEALVPPHLLGVPLHPTQVYETAGNLALAALLHFQVLPRTRSGEYREGAATLAYFAVYPALRFLIETLRADDRGFYAWGLSVSQWLSLGLLAAAACIWRRRAR